MVEAGKSALAVAKVVMDASLEKECTRDNKQILSVNISCCNFGC